MIRRLPSFFTNPRDTIPKSGDSDLSLPPPYTPTAAPPFLLTETRTTRTQVTTTTTETTTETKTHVHTSPNDIGVYPGRLTLDVKQTMRSFAVDKALPPTPPSAGDSPRASTSSTGPSSTFSLPAISHLGSATLAVSLPPAAGIDVIKQPTKLPGASVSFPLLPPATGKLDGQSLRRPKSSYRLEEPDEADLIANANRRRSRGLSLGATSWLNLGSAQDGKGKGKEKAEDRGADAFQESPISESQSLSRRPSFWTRRKNTAPLSPPLPPPPPLQPPLSSPIAVERSATLPSPSKSPIISTVKQAHSGSEAQTPNGTLHPRSPSLVRRHSDITAETPAKSGLDSHPYSTIPRSRTAKPSAIDTRASPSQEREREAVRLSRNPPDPLELSPSPRPRAQTNPPLLHRLSSALFSFSDTPSIHSSPKHSFSTCASPIVTSRDIPKPKEDIESPDVYVSRLRSLVNKAEIAVVLASSSDLFYVDALNCFLLQFDFHDEPLDIALRKLLMDVGLPRETQQIDRVMEAFSSRYSDCNPNLFAEKDHGYVLAFSLIMLHTDAFNKSNKNKMTKADYVKNTALAGLPAEVLGCYYDNIVFAPFIFIEDHSEANSQALAPPGGSSTSLRTPSSASTTNLLGMHKIDPYYLITNDLLESMRQDVETLVPLDEPFSCDGFGPSPWTEGALQKAFSNAGVIDVESSARPSTDSGPGDPDLSGRGSSSSMSIKVTKVGILNRKDAIGPRGKRNTFRKWRYWSVILTGSQLLWFRDPALAQHVRQNLNDGPADDVSGISLLKPDEITSLKDGIAVYDKTYTKHAHTFRFAVSNGREILLQSANAEETEEWMKMINYASAFKTAGVRIRPLGMSPDDMHMTGVAAATSLLHDVQSLTSSPSAPIKEWDKNHSRELMGMLTADSFTHRPSFSRNRLTILPSDDFDVETMSTLETATSQQFEATFKRVKADLAHDSDNPYIERLSFDAPPQTPSTPLNTTSFRPPSRTGVVQNKIEELRSRLAAARSQLDDDLRLVRNIAILKPFQKAARSRLLQPIQGVARKVALLRLEVMRYRCHIMVLTQDLESESRSMHQMQSIALEAAKQSLDRGADSIPRMTISTPGHDLICPQSPFAGSWSNSSECESFKSAVEDPEVPELDDTPPASSLALSQISDSRSCTMFPSATHWTASSASRSSVERSASCSSSKGGSPQISDSPRDDLAEEAEAWNMTRCAQRVSLIRVPSTLAFQIALPPDGRK